MGDHMPVHLGSMPMSVSAAIARCALMPGDMVMLNDPFAAHAPADITLVAPVYVRSGRSGRGAQISTWHARAHHADVGGVSGSMGLCREIYQEGFQGSSCEIMRSAKMDD